MGGLGPTTLKPVPETDAWEMVRLDLVVLVMAASLIKLLPTCTVPKSMLEEDAVWLAAVFEIKKTEQKIRDQQAGLQGDPVHIILVSLTLHVLTAHGQGNMELAFALARLRLRNHNLGFILSSEKNLR